MHDNNYFTNKDYSTKVIVACVIITIVLSTTAIIGWLAGYDLLTSLYDAYIPMAPSTAISFLLLTAIFSIFIYIPNNRRLHSFIRAILVLMVIAQLIILLHFFVPAIVDIESIFFKNPPEFIGVQIGRMSFVTALLLVICSISILLFSTKNHSPSKIAVFLITISFITALIFDLGYLYQTPLLYNKSIIPPALNTAICFSFLQLGILLEFGRNYYPIKLFIGQSITARLMRNFFPLTLAVIILSGFINSLGYVILDDHILVSSVVTIIFSILLGILIIRAAKNTGVDLENLFKELKQTENALKGSENKFRLFFENSPIGKSITAIDGTIQVNKAFCDMLGYSEKELLQINFREITIPEDIINSENVIQELLDGRTTNFNFIKRYLHKNGSIVWGNVNTTLQKDEQGKPLFFMSSVNDITQTVLAEELLQQTRANLAAALESMTDAVFISNLEGEFIEFNEAFASFHRFSNKEECAKNLSNYPDIIDVFMDNGKPAPLEMWAVPRALRGETETNIEYTLRRKDTGETWVGSYSFSPIHDKKGAIIGSVVVGRDITEQKRIEEILIESESRYRGLFNNMLNGFAYCKMIYEDNGKPDFMYLEVNDSFERLTDLKNVIGKKVSEVIPGIQESDDKLLYLYAKAASTGVPERFEIYVESLSMWFDISVYCPQKNYFVAVFDVITKRKLTEKELIESEEKFMTAFQNSPVTLALTSLDDGKYVDVNETFLNDMGYSKEEVIGKTSLELEVFDDHNERERLINEVKQKGRIFAQEYKFKTKKGAILTGLLSTVICQLKNKDYLLSTVIDITRRKQIENEIKATTDALIISEGKYRNLFTEMTSGFALHRIINDTNGVAVDYEFIEINPAFEELTGMLASAVCGKTVKKLLPEIENYWIENYGKVANEGISLSFTNYNKALDRHYNVYAYCPDKGYFAVIFSDYTQQKKALDKITILNHNMEEKNTELERLIFVASHDLRSPLVNIQGFGGELKNLFAEAKKIIEKENDITIVRNKLSAIIDNEIPESLSFIELSANKMNQLISGMLKVSRLGRSELTIEKINMNTLMTQVTKTFEFVTKKENIQIKIEKLPDCFADKILLDQLFTNLISNAIKFRSNQREAQIIISATQNESQLIYCIEDNGIGFSEKYLDKIFLLFHRLNNEIDGEGLGLSIVKKIVDIHNGKVWAESEIDEGSKFFIALNK